MTAPALSSTPENEHPIETAEYLLSTPAIEESIGDIVKWIRNRFTGGMVVGPQRFGKSHLIDYCLIELSRYIPGISIKVAECSTYRFPAELAFLEEMLHDLGHVLATVSSCSKGRIRIVSFLNSEATSSGTRRIVLFFDEAQNLHEHHYRILMGFHNRLRRLGISLTVILVGQPSLRAQKSSFVGQDKKEIVARFMTHVNDFHGIRTQKELCECLESYDEHSEFPEGSKQSFTAHYYPVAFRNGWRLAAYAGSLWNAFAAARKKVKRRTAAELPMEYFCRSVEFILRAGRQLDGPKTKLPDDLFEDAILECGYLDFINDSGQ